MSNQFVVIRVGGGDGLSGTGNREIKSSASGRSGISECKVVRTK